jgi:hypothetical protein
MLLRSQLALPHFITKMILCCLKLLCKLWRSRMKTKMQIIFTVVFKYAMVIEIQGKIHWGCVTLNIIIIKNCQYMYLKNKNLVLSRKEKKWQKSDHFWCLLGSVITEIAVITEQIALTLFMQKDMVFQHFVKILFLTLIILLVIF